MTKPANFPLFFYDGSRKEAQRRADEDYRGNLTAYINALIKADTRKFSKEFMKAQARIDVGLRRAKEGRTKKSKP